MKKGTLHLIPTTLGEVAASEVIPEAVLSISQNLVYFIAENERTARRYLKSIGTNIPLNDLQFGVLNKHTDASEVLSLTRPLLEGIDMGLISEAGLPAIADPGAAIVSWCHNNGVQVMPHSGPSSIILALIASGFNGQRFTFHGYLPIEQKERQQAIRAMERLAEKEDVSQIFMETPFRNEKLLDQILEACMPNTHLSIACNISMPSAYIKSAMVLEWRKQRPSLHKKPCIFIIGRPQ